LHPRGKQITSFKISIMKMGKDKKLIYRGYNIEMKISYINSSVFFVNDKKVKVYIDEPSNLLFSDIRNYIVHFSDKTKRGRIILDKLIVNYKTHIL